MEPKSKHGDDRQVGLLPDLPPGTKPPDVPEDFVMYPKWVEGIIVQSAEEEVAVRKSAAAAEHEAEPKRAK